MSSTKKGKSKGKDITSEIFTSTTEVLPSAPRFGVSGEGGRGGYNRNGGRGGYNNQYPAKNDFRGSSNKESSPADYEWKRGSNAQPTIQGRVSGGVGDSSLKPAERTKSLNDFDWSMRGTAQPQPPPNTSLPSREGKEITPQKSLNDFDWSMRGTAQPQPQPSALPQKEPKENTPQKSLNDFDWSVRGAAQPQPQLPAQRNTSLQPREPKEVTPQKSLSDFDWSLRGTAQPQPQPQSLPPSTHSNTSRSTNHNSSSISEMDWSRKEQPPPPSSSSSLDNPLPSQSDDNKPFHHSRSSHSDRKDVDWNIRGLPQPKREDYNNNNNNNNTDKEERWTSVGANGKPRRNEYRTDDRSDNNYNNNRNDGKRLLTRDGMKGRDIFRRDNNNNNNNESIDKKEIVEKPIEKPVEKEEEKPVEKPIEKEIPSLEELKEKAKQKNANIPSTFLEPSNKKQSTTTTTTTSTSNTPAKDTKNMPSVEELKEQARLRNLNQNSTFLSKPTKELSKLFYYNDKSLFDDGRKRRINTSINELITNRKNDDTIEDIKELKLKENEKMELIKEIIIDLCDYNKSEDQKLVYELINRLYKEKLIKKVDIFCGLSIINNNKEDLKCDIPKINDYYTELYKYLSKNELIDYEPMSKDIMEIEKYGDINKYFNELKGEELTEKLISNGFIENIINIFEIFLCHLIIIDNDDDDDDNKPILCEEYEGVYIFPLLNDDNKYGDVLKRLIGNIKNENQSDIKEIQLKCIDLVCKYSSLLEHPTEWCESLFMNLYDKYVISEESYKEWKNKSIIEEKNRILEDCKDFFEWLEIAEYEEE